MQAVIVCVTKIAIIVPKRRNFAFFFVKIFAHMKKKQYFCKKFTNN